jgi:hypothetical protein
VHAHPLARHILERPIDRRDHALDEAEELAKRPVLIADVALEREIGAVQLQQEAVADDRLVLDPERVRERIEVGVLGIVVLVLDRGGDDARRGRGQERLDETAVRGIERRLEVVAFGVDCGRIEVAHRADRLGRVHVADRGPARELLLHHALEDRVAGGVAARPPLPGAPEAAHPMLHVQEKALALLLAVVADVDPGGDLLGHDPAQRLPACFCKLSRVDRLALRAAHVQPDQLGRPRQTAGVGGQNPLLAPPHRPLQVELDGSLPEITLAE